MVQHHAPLVKSKAVIDDRSLQGPPDQLHAALLLIFVFDALAGHITNPEKITLSACTQRDRKVISQWAFGGIKPPLVQVQKLVGDVITTLKNGASQLANSRLEFAIRTSARIKAADCSAKGKQWAMQTMAIPRMVPSTLWTKPLESRLKTLRTAVVGTVLSRKRSLRCHEVVVSLRMNPVRADPKSVIIYRSLLDTRRILRKSSERTADFIQHLRNAVKRNKLDESQLCIGPVKSFVQTAAQLFREFPIKGQDLLLTPEIGPACCLLGSTDEEFKNFMTQTVRQSIWTGLAEEMRGDNPRRKDMQNFTGQVNLHASLLGAVPPKKKGNFIPPRLWKQLHLTVLSGATVAGDRLMAMGKSTSDVCPLDLCRHTSDHLFWHCSAYAFLRRPFTDRIGQILGAAVNKVASVQQYITSVLDDTAFRNLGIVPADPLAPEFAKKQWKPFSLKPPVTEDMLVTADRCALKARWAGRTYSLVFTDGSVKLARHPWLAHGGWGIFTGHGSSANDHGCLEGPPFTSYRAELRGILEACSRAVDPVWVVCDNQAVVDQAAALFAKACALRTPSPHVQDLELATPLDKQDHDVMWDSLAGLVDNAPINFYRISWIPGHLLDNGKEDKLEEYLSTGGTLAMAQGNRAAAALAEQGAKLASPPLSMLWREHLVKQLAKVVQTMQITIWAAYKGHVCSDLELSAAEVGLIADSASLEETSEIFDADFDDPFMSEFLAQEDGDFDPFDNEPDLYQEAGQGEDYAGNSDTKCQPCGSTILAHVAVRPHVPLDDLALDRRRLGKGDEPSTGRGIKRDRSLVAPFDDCHLDHARLAKKREATNIEEAVKKSVVGHHDAVDLAADVQIHSLSAESPRETTAENQPPDTISDNAMKHKLTSKCCA